MSAPIESCYAYGYDAVGPGWKRILEELDQEIKTLVSPPYRINIIQIKEKLGGLRVYFAIVGGGEDTSTKLKIIDAVFESIGRAERKSFETCELCGDTGYPDKIAKHGLIATFCKEHHKEWKETKINPLQRIWEES